MEVKYRLTTLGCKVNQYETEQVRELLESFGLRAARKGEHADLAIVNTCAVTCSATAKSRQALRRQSNRGATPTIAIGCYASADPEAIHRIPGVTRVLGHDAETLSAIREAVVERLGELGAHPSPELYHTDTSARPVAPVAEANEPTNAADTLVAMGLRLRSRSTQAPPTLTDTRRPPPHRSSSTIYHSIVPKIPIVNGNSDFSIPIREFSSRTRAFLKVQDGCDASCTYCIIPKLRTRLGWKEIDQAAAEARGLVAAGHREIVLTGIFLGAFGRDTAIRKRFKSGPSPLAALVDTLARIDGLARLRLSSLEPGDVDDALLATIAEHDNCVPHFHLPLQHGSDTILRKMNRQYTAGDFVDMIERVNGALDRPAISTDVIVGFPGETDALFEETMAMVRRSRFCKIHAFPFSPRQGTAAYRWSRDFVHQATVKDRMGTLRELEQQLALEYNRQFVGDTVRVIVEGNMTSDHSGSSGQTFLAHGRCDRYFEVHFESNNSKPGDMVNVCLDRVTHRRVHGTLLGPG